VKIKTQKSQYRPVFQNLSPNPFMQTSNLPSPSFPRRRESSVFAFAIAECPAARGGESLDMVAKREFPFNSHKIIK
jgi:hypothetical protein